MTEIQTQKDFEAILNQESGILHLFVSWAATSVVSHKMLQEISHQQKSASLPLHWFDCSKEPFWIRNWIFEQKESNPDFIYAGNGETLLLKKGKLVDFVPSPAEMGLEKTRKKLAGW